MILPQSDGPYMIDKVYDGHTCSLVDAVSRLPFQNGQRISLARLIAFKYPPEFLGPEAVDPPSGLTVEALRPNDMVAVEIRVKPKPRVHVARVVRTFVANAFAEVELWSVGTTERYGPWSRRRWSVMQDEGGAHRYEIVPEAEILCRVDLQEKALSSESIEKLALLGVPVSLMPGRDAAITLS